MTADRRELTRLEQTIDRAAHRWLARRPESGARAVAVECAVFLLKQAWACVFGALLLVAIVAARLWYPDDAALARNDALTIAAVLIQVGMLVFRLESGRELWVIVRGPTRPKGCCGSGPCHSSAASCTRRSGRTWCASTGCTSCGSRATRASG
jgi:hypothetical protein